MREGERRLAALVLDASRRPRLSGGRVFCAPFPKPAKALRMSSGFWTFFMVMLISMAATELQDSQLKTEETRNLMPRELTTNGKVCELSADVSLTTYKFNFKSIQYCNISMTSIEITIGVSAGVKNV